MSKSSMDMSFRLYRFSTSVSVFDTFSTLCIYDEKHSANAALLSFFLDDEHEARALENAFNEIARHREHKKLKSEEKAGAELQGSGVENVTLEDVEDVMGPTPEGPPQLTPAERKDAAKEIPEAARADILSSVIDPKLVEPVAELAADPPRLVPRQPTD